MARFISYVSPVISVTKWHDTDNDTWMYDLYINGRFDTRYHSYLKLNQRIQSIIIGGMADENIEENR